MVKSKQIDPALVEVIVAFLMGTILTWVFAQLFLFSSLWNINKDLTETLDLFRFGIVDALLTGFLLMAKWFFRKEKN